MIIVKLMGGLGNQMFQYAFGRQLAIRRNSTLKLDLTFFLENSTTKNMTQREYELDIFDHKAQIATDDEIADFKIEGGQLNKILQVVRLHFCKKFYIKEPVSSLYKDLAALPGPIYLDGYWQNESYFKSITRIIREDFQFKSGIDIPSLLLQEEIKRTESVCLHVRRTDYVTNPSINRFHGTCSLEYYHKAVELLAARTKNPEFFIFSDDPDWCKENIHLKNYSFKIIGPEHDGNRYHNKFKLMTTCKHFIIANSSFGWWAAWLGRHANKVVVAPQRWFNDERKNKASQIVPLEWNKI